MIGLDAEISVRSLLTALTWFAAIALLLAGGALGVDWLLAAGIAASVAGSTLTVLRDGERTRRLTRALWNAQMESRANGDVRNLR
ncbi:hypothetical protein [Nocardioides aquiterrae]|uniref:DUF2530 domain-containing protein n=1 Tax=Nocardioides aquiterrae TaxID=203799 RepID=A0ABN1UJK3_9ACTN